MLGGWLDRYHCAASVAGRLNTIPFVQRGGTRVELCGKIMELTLKPDYQPIIYGLLCMADNIHNRLSVG
jgi:hypothetical protein